MAIFQDLNDSGGNTHSRETAPCRSFVMFNGTGTVSVFTSFKLSSITDAGTGHYRINLSNANPNNTYCCLATGTGGNSSGGTATCDSTNFDGNGSNYPNSSTSYQIRTVSGTGGGQDMQWVNTATWRVN